MIQDSFCSVNRSVSYPHQMIQALGRLQAQSFHRPSNSVYVYDLVEQRTLCNSYPIAAMLGYTADAIRTMGPIGLASLIHPDDLDRVSEHYQHFTTLRDGEVIAIEYRMQRADGTWCWLRSQETPIVQAIDGLPLQILGLIQDITPVDTFRSRQISLLRRTRRCHHATRTVKIIGMIQPRSLANDRKPAS
ncbi:PAS domain-containing protein [Egbenema bharatensis]|uniref:PAS domain-containing protein n=1 Tax=Egbenema bharatensis TaxID=3463334 RepID=UPI003A8922F0